MREIWTPGLEEKIARKTHVTVHPGMMFSLAKDTMEKTKLWKIVRKMPKGALLHAHCDAMVDFDYLFEVLLNTPGLHIWCEDSHLATAEARETASILVRFKQTPHTEGSLWQEDYVPGTPILLTQAADDFPGGRPEFLKWLKSRCTISQTEAISQHHGVAHIWQKFQDCFIVIGTFIHYEPVFRAFLRRLMSKLYEDGISWVEIRYAQPLVLKALVVFVFCYYLEGEIIH